MAIAVPGPPEGPNGPEGPTPDQAAHDAPTPDEQAHGDTPEPTPGDPSAPDPAVRLSQVASEGRERLLADTSLIEALVRIDEIEVAARFIDKQREDLVSYAIDLREAVAEAVRARGDEVSEPPADDSDELG